MLLEDMLGNMLHMIIFTKRIRSVYEDPLCGWWEVVKVVYPCCSSGCRSYLMIEII